MIPDDGRIVITIANLIPQNVILDFEVESYLRNDIEVLFVCNLLFH